MKMQLTIYQHFASVFFVLTTALWFGLFVTNTTEGFYNYLFSFLFGLTPLVGGIIAMVYSDAWGRFKSEIGTAMFYIGLGIFLWGAGECVWSYYNFFLSEPAPYPSLADVGFAPSIFFYGLGSIYLARASGAQILLKQPHVQAVTALAIVVCAWVAYYVSVTLARGGVVVPEGETAIKIVLDIAYPLGGSIAFIVAATISGLSFKYLGGIHKKDIRAILAGLFVMFIADAIFSYTTSVGTYYNANGGDLLLSVGTFLLTFGVLGFVRVQSE